MHATTWLERLARHPGEPRDRLIASLEELAPDAATVFTLLDGEALLVETGLIAEPMTALEARWRATITPLFVGLDLPMPPPGDLDGGRTTHSEPFRWLWGEFTSVRRSDPGAIW